MIIAVDFDGTIHDGQWPRIGEAMPGAREAINALRAEGHYIIIWTCREGRQQTEMVNWLLEKGIGFDRINDHRPDEVAAYGSNARKVYAHCYVDDKNVGGMLPWKDIVAWIRSREATYRGRLRTPAASAEAGKSAGYMTKNQFKAPNDPRITPKTDLKPAATLILGQKSIWSLRRGSFHAKNRI